MTLKDKFEIFYWLISLLILGVTISAIYISPIRATKIGRDLNVEQSHRDAKMQLFLELFALRGDAVNYRFVEGLNKIAIVFSDDKEVLSAWKNYFNGLCKIRNDSTNPLEIQSLKTALLYEMAYSLGYKNLQQLEILNDFYSPVAHGDYVNAELQMKKVQFDYFVKGSELNSILVEYYRKILNDQEQ